MKNKKLLIFLLLAVPLGIWFAVTLGDFMKPKPTITKVDQVNGPELRYSEKRIAHKETLIERNYILRDEDQQVVDALKNEGTPLLLTDNVNLRYDRNEDLFVAEITTIRIEPAKREAVAWLKDKGLSTEALCILPVTFTINEQSAASLKGFNLIFDPLPSECK